MEKNIRCLDMFGKYECTFIRKNRLRKEKIYEQPTLEIH